MNSIIDNKEELIIINKSKFICCLYKINDVEEVNQYINQVKEKYRDATHYCYAYILNSSKKCSDDNEPSGTAGLPILNVLEKNNLNNVLAIVVRYFGGIKLGAGGLVRAYTNSVVNCLNNNLIEIVKGYKLELTFKYDKVKLIDNLIKNILSKSFDEVIKYEVLISYSDYESIKEKLESNCDVKIIAKDVVI